MIKTLSQLIETLQQQQPKKIAIAGAQQDELLLAYQAYTQHLATFVLIGDEEKLYSAMEAHHIPKHSFTIINEPNHDAAARLAVKMVKSGEVDIPMKGLMHTGSFLKAVLDKDVGLATNKRISQITLFNGYNGTLQFLTDCAINIKPTLKEKQGIIENAVWVAQKMGYQTPLVALLGSVETVSESMPDTIDSAVLTQMNKRGQIKGCIIDGPLSLDNAICKQAAELKGIHSEVAGNADILVAAELQVANTFSKALHYYAKLDTASVIVGTTSPIIMTSRTDELKNKLLSIAASCYLGNNT